MGNTCNCKLHNTLPQSTHFSDPNTPAIEKILCHSWNSKDSLHCYFHSSGIWQSLTYQKHGILNHTTVKTSKLTCVMLVLACCCPLQLARWIQYMFFHPVPLHSILILLSMRWQHHLRFSDQNFEFIFYLSHGQRRQKLLSFSGFL